MKHKTWKMTWT